MSYFTDRNFGARARTAIDIDGAVRQGILGIIRARATDGSFGLSFPDECEDGQGTTGTYVGGMKDALAAHRLYNLFERNEEVPPTYELLDLIEFSYEKIAKPIQGGYHPFYRHYHLRFDQAEGRAAFRDEVNTIFARNGIAYELKETGEIERLAPEVLGEALAEALFQTGDATLNELLEKARAKFLSRDPAIRRESLEALWDAWERLKSLEPAKDKRESTTRLLDKASAEPNLRRLLETEAKLLTDIGNDFMIRHTEVTKVPITDDEHVDFLFHRLFAVIRLLLKKSNRGR